MGDLIVHPEVAALLERVEHAKQQLALLLEEREHLLQREALAWRMVYFEKIGVLEQELFELECELARKRRRFELIQALLNRRMPVDERRIDEQLEQEFQEYLQTLHEMAAEQQWYLFWRDAEKLEPAVLDELKALYRQLIKWLHPDVNLDLSELQRALWHRVIAAYEANDLEMLKMLHGLAEAERSQYQLPAPSNGGTSGASEDVLQTLRNRSSKMELHARQIILELDAIRTQFPFSFIELLNDPRQVTERRAQLQERLAAVRQVLRTLEDSMPYGGTGGGFIH
jgi:hypothetical protein